jgi:uncharacterized C2H2 Zn-finger protein
MCPDCGAAFADPAELIQHLAKTHAGGDPRASMAMNPYSETPGFTCSLCGATFATPKELADHDLRPHPKVRRWGRSRRVGGANIA